MIESKDRKKAWRSNPENVARERRYAVAYYKTNKDKIIAEKRNKLAAEKLVQKHWELKSHLRRRYNMTVEQYNAMLDSQNDRCAICESSETGRKDGRWSVDHCHATKIVRGILCLHCNAVLGYAKDNPDTLLRASQYLSNTIGAGQ